MTIEAATQITLGYLLRQQQTNSASEYVSAEEYINDEGKLGAATNQMTEDAQVADRLAELRCTDPSKSCVVYSGRLIEPGLRVFQWQQIPFSNDGEVRNNFRITPAWIVKCVTTFRPRLLRD